MTDSFPPHLTHRKVPHLTQLRDIHATPRRDVLPRPLYRRAGLLTAAGLTARGLTPAITRIRNKTVKERLS